MKKIVTVTGAGRLTGRQITFGKEKWLTDVNGLVWVNNLMGWEATRGKRVVSRRPLGHMEFYRTFKPATKKNIEAVPDHGVDNWRSPLTLNKYRHAIYGSVRMIRTDGVIAYVLLNDSRVTRVMLDNLTEIKPEPDNKSRKVTKATTAAKKKAQKEAEKLAAILDLL